MGQQRKVESAPQSITTPTHAHDLAPQPAAAAPSILPVSPGIASAKAAVAADARVNLDETDEVPRPEHESNSAAHAEVETSREDNASSNLEKYFEVGKFKDDLSAHNSTDKLKQLGFHATISKKGHLWTKYYYVLVGPYGVHDDTEAARKNLKTSGFNPRVFERGSRSFTFGSGLTLNGSPVSGGDYLIRWEAYSPDANVEFVKRDSVVATADGKWVQRGARYQDDAYVYRKNGDGSRTLLEIRFSGMSQVLAFSTSTH